MATVTGLTAQRMTEIEDASVVSGTVQGDNLVLTTHGGAQIQAGNVRGPKGDTGAQGAAGTSGFTGQICDFPKSPVPAGWLVCDGTIYNISQYPALGAYLGNTFGGDGTTTFGVPNYAGKVRVHLDAAQTEFNAAGKTGGEKTHVLSVAELATHTHTDSLAAPQHTHTDTLAAPAHTHSMAHTHGGVIRSDTTGGLSAPPLGTQMPGGSTNAASVSATGAASATALTGSVGAASATALTGGINNTGSSTGHNNLQPYVVTVAAIKT